MGMNPTPLLPEYLTNALENIKMTRKYPKHAKLSEIRRGIKLAKVYIKAHQLNTLGIDTARARNLNQELTNNAHALMHGIDGDSDSYVHIWWDDPEPPHLYPETKDFRKAFHTTLRKYFDKIDNETTT